MFHRSRLLAMLFSSHTAGATQFGNIIGLSGSTGKLANDNCDGKSAVISLRR